MVSTSSLKNLQKTEKCPFQTLGTFVFELTVASKSFSKKFPMTKFWLRKFLIFFLNFLRKRFQLRHSKICKKTKTCPFQTLRIFVFELKVISKPFSKKLPITKFWFKKFSMFCLTFPENGFNFVTQKFAKNWKMPFSNALLLHFCYLNHIFVLA